MENKLERVTDEAIRSINPGDFGFVQIPGELEYSVLPIMDGSVVGAAIYEITKYGNGQEWSEVVKRLTLDEIADYLENK